MTATHTAGDTGRSATDPLAVAVQALKVTATRLAQVEARHRASAPGRWHWWTSNSWRRLSSDPGDGRTKDGGVLCPCVSPSDRHPDLIVSEEDMAFIAEAHQDVPDLAADHRSLSAVAEIAAQTASVWEEWLGGASTWEAGVDSLLRLTRALQRTGFKTSPRPDNLDWRRSLLDELWKAGFFRGADGLMRLDPQQRKCGDAEGPTLAEVAAGFLAARAVSPEAANRHADAIEAIANELDIDRSDPESVLEAIRDLKRRVKRFEQIVSAPQHGEDLSHAEVAGKVRMLMRHDLDHEAVCVMARDRIMWLANRVGDLEAERDRLKVRFYTAADVQAVMGDDTPVPGPNGNSIPWIKRLRERCGCTLVEAKHAHDLLVALNTRAEPVGGLSTELRQVAGGQSDGFGRIYLRAADTLDAQETELAQIKAMLADPLAVLVNMKRGSIATPSLRGLLDLHPSALEHWDGAVDRSEHDRRVTELLEANNREVTRRRLAERVAAQGAELAEVLQHMAPAKPYSRDIVDNIVATAKHILELRATQAAGPAEALAVAALREVQNDILVLLAVTNEDAGRTSGEDRDNLNAKAAGLTRAASIIAAAMVPYTDLPLPMVLHCPRCGLQHIDAPDEATGWTNPPHRSHLCAGCGTTWRPADFPTTGVEAVEARGKADSWPPSPKVDGVLVEGVLPLMALGSIPPWAVGKISMPDPDRPGFRIVGFRVPVKPVTDAGAAMRTALDQLATFRDGDAEARMEADAEHLNCPACGGSGHVDDVRPAGTVATRDCSTCLSEADDSMAIPCHDCFYDHRYPRWMPRPAGTTGTDQPESGNVG